MIDNHICMKICSHQVFKIKKKKKKIKQTIDLIKNSSWTFLFLIYMIVLGLAIGIPFGIMDYVLDIERIRKLSYWKIILLKVSVQIGIAAFSMATLATINNRLDESNVSIIRFVISETSLLWIIFSAIVSFFIYFMLSSGDLNYQATAIQTFSSN